MEDTRDRILAAALELFSARGYAAVGTRAIAQAAGVNAVTPFRCFGSKRNLYVEVFRRYALPASGAAVPARFGGDLPAELAAVGRGLAALFLNNDKIVRMSIKDLEEFPEIEGELRAQPGRLSAAVGGYLRSAGEVLPLDGDLDRAAGTFVSAVMGATLNFIHTSQEDLVFPFVESLCAIFARGLLGRAPPAPSAR